MCDGTGLLRAQLPAGADVYDVDEIADCVWILHEGSCVETGPSGEEGQVIVLVLF